MQNLDIEAKIVKVEIHNKRLTIDVKIRVNEMSFATTVDFYDYHEYTEDKLKQIIYRKIRNRYGQHLAKLKEKHRVEQITNTLKNKTYTTNDFVIEEL